MIHIAYSVHYALLHSIIVVSNRHVYILAALATSTLILDVYDSLVEAFPDDDDACADLLAYFGTYYVRGQQVGNRARAPRFPPALWNHTQDSLDCAPV